MLWVARAQPYVKVIRGGRWTLGRPLPLAYHILPVFHGLWKPLYLITHLAASRSASFLCSDSHTAAGSCMIEIGTLGQCLGFCLPFDQ